MRVKVESCFNGHKIVQRLTMPNSERLILSHEEWSRKVAGEAKDIISLTYNVKRQNIRFI